LIEQDLTTRRSQRAKSAAHLKPVMQTSVSKVEGSWDQSESQAGFIQQCKLFWESPINEVPTNVLAIFLRHSIALEIVIPEAQSRLANSFSDDTELYDGELAEALARASST